MLFKLHKIWVQAARMDIAEYEVVSIYMLELCGYRYTQTICQRASCWASVSIDATTIN